MSKERELLKEVYKELVECEKVTEGFLINYSIDLLFYEIEELLAQPEQDLEVLKKDWVNFGYTAGRREGYKREAIEDGELEVWYSQHAWAMDKQEYIWGFRDAEKAHGIGGE